MSNSKFRLQRVLDYRRHLAERTQLELAVLRARCTQEEQRLEQHRAAERATLARLAECQRRSSVDLTEVLQLNGHLDVLATRIAEQTAVVQQVRADADQLQEGLVEQTRDAKALEKLRDRQLEEQALEAKRLERIEMNELAAQQFRRLGVAS